MKRKFWLGLFTGVVAVQRLVRRLRRYELRGKVVVITGGARGLGLVLARESMNRGSDVAICSRDAEEVDRARADLIRRGTGQVFATVCDLNNPDQLVHFLERTEQQLGPIDVLINNAGMIQVGPLESMAPQDFEAALTIHFWAPLQAIFAVLPRMRRRHSGRIVNITSIGAKVAVPHMLPYSVSKFAEYGLSSGLRAELASEGIVVTTVCPGFMRTGSAQMKGKQQDEYALFELADSLPGLTISAERAARQILNACVRGDAEVVLSLPGKLLASLYAFTPGFVQNLFGLIPRMLSRLTDAAALRNNEV